MRNRARVPCGAPRGNFRMVKYGKLTTRAIAMLGPGDHADGSGLFLRVNEQGKRSWRLVTYIANPPDKGGRASEPWSLWVMPARPSPPPIWKASRARLGRCATRPVVATIPGISSTRRLRIAGSHSKPSPAAPSKAERETSGSANVMR